MVRDVLEKLPDGQIVIVVGNLKPKKNCDNASVGRLLEKHSLGNRTPRKVYKFLHVSLSRHWFQLA